MASKYDGLARIIIQNVGGKANINSITHCVTRLRFRLKDESKANTDILKETDGVVTVIQAGGQYQVVIGNHVDYVYDAVLDVGHLHDKAAGSVDEDGNAIEGGEGASEGKKNALNTFIDLVSGILQPTLGVLGASGIVKGILACLTYFKLLSSSSGTYQIMYAFGDGFFYFLPIFLGYTTAKKMKMNEFIGLAIGAGLVYPNMVALKSAEALGTVFAGTAFKMSYTTKFLGIPVFFPASGYTSSVIPVILTVIVASKIYKWARKVIPEMVQLFLVPLVVIVVSLPLCYIVIGPVSGLFCGVLQTVFNILYNLPVVGGALAGIFVAAIWQVCVIFGLHWGLVPLMLLNMSTLGYDYVLVPNIVCSWTQVAALAAILMTTKDDKLKKVAIPALISGFFGVTEPAIYGVTLPKKTPFIISCVASAVGGAFLGAMGVKKFMSGGMGLFALPTFIDGSEGGVGMRNLYLVVIAILISMAITFVLVKFTWKDNAPKKTAAPAAPAADPNADKSVAAVAEGTVVALADVKDEAFASEAMGKGCAIEPTVGKVYAPADGSISVFFPTGHAIGMVTDAGVEVLIHVGIDTVDMNGDGFSPKKKQGDTVKKGELLLEFDIAKVKAANHEATTMVIITNTADYEDVTGTTAATVKPGDAFITIK